MHTIKNHPRIILAITALLAALILILMFIDFGNTLHTIKRGGVLNYVLSSLVTPDVNDDYGDPLIKAILQFKKSEFNTLLEGGIDPNGISEKISPLFFASKSYDLHYAQLLLTAGADPNGISWGGGERKGFLSAPLVGASRVGDIEMINLLLSSGANINIGSGTPILTAASTDNWLTVLYLIRKGADCGVYDANNGLWIGALADHSKILGGTEQGNARDSVIQILQKNGFPWPPPSPEETLKLIEEGKWPSCTVRE